jgi:CRP/FNR family cyclic AMP-dependent transcriptional regulator
MRFHSSRQEGHPAHRLVRVLDADPDLGAPLSHERRAAAAERLVARCVGARAGTVADSSFRAAGPGGLGLLVLDGLLAREILLSDNVSVELLGAGDLIQDSASDDPGRLLRSAIRWTVVEPARLAILGSRFAAELNEYPEVTSVLFSRLVQRSHRLGIALAIAQLNGVDRRILALFWHLAERWGRVSGDGVIVPLALTHRILGQLVGARRPTVSTALSELAEREELTRRPDGSWLLRGDPPDAESLARKPAPAGAGVRNQDLMRPARRFEREQQEPEPEVVTAIDRLRDALEPGELRELLDRRRGGPPDDAA